MKLKRTGPRCTFWFDLDSAWLKPSWSFNGKLGYVQFAFFSVGFGFGRARDLMWDCFDSGVYAKRHSDINDLQHRCAAWVEKTFGISMLTDKEERGMRMLEEAIEVAQAIGVPRERAALLVNVVYDKPAGDVEQEIGGLGTTVLTLATTLGANFLETTEKEVSRIESLPAEHFRKRNVAKAAAGVGNYGEPSE